MRESEQTLAESAQPHRRTAPSRWSRWRDALYEAWSGTTKPKRRDQVAVAEISDLALSLRRESDRELTERVEQLRDAVRRGAEVTSPEILPQGFALATEAIRRAIGITCYDVQVLGGLALSRRTIAEIQTGEGKTFVAAFPAILYALAGDGVHAMTVNPYLAERDFELLAPAYRLLGISVGLLRPQAAPADRRAAYGCDITYGPGYEFGFDYLRDHAALTGAPQARLGENFRRLMSGELPGPRAGGSVQRGHAFAIVDEADSVMIDEATTPLVLSAGPSCTAPDAEAYVAARDVAGAMVAEQDFVVEPSGKLVRLTSAGADKFNRGIGNESRCAGIVRPWRVYVEQALHAALFLRRDVDYIVSDGHVVLVDQFTGRVLADRTLRDGLHQAVEAKEGLEVTAETQSLAHISRQRYFRLYRGVCGMTGTASGSERELRQVYGLPVVSIPTRVACQRRELPTRYFASQESKWAAIVTEFERLHQTRQPVLVGTSTIENSELLARQLAARAVPFRLLNGKQDEAEAAIVARAGEAGAITISTNMAGRGTDIKLGPGVAEFGGLHVIGTERNESARIDRQLIGRAARQGDPGSCQFFVSADDSLIRTRAPWLADRMRQHAPDGGEIPVGTELSRDVATIQSECERTARTRRSRLFTYENWLENVMARLSPS